MNKVFASLTAFAMAASLGGAAFAHTDHDDEHAKPVLTLELVKKGNGAAVFVKRDGAGYPTAGATGMLRVMTGSRQTELPLHASGTNAMETKGDAKIPAGAKVEATIRFADKNVATSRFVMK